MRRTKEESEQTRQAIVDAARRVFAKRGVAHSTLELIAEAAGVTRGAIYWHFANKSQLFNAMREQVSLPLMDRTDFALLGGDGRDPLDNVENFLRSLIAAISDDEATRSTFEIMNLKCEYVDEFETELKRHNSNCAKLLDKLIAVYRRARVAGVLRNDMTPEIAALDTCVFVTGLMRQWLMNGAAGRIREHTGKLIKSHVASRRAAIVSNVASVTSVAASRIVRDAQRPRALRQSRSAGALRKVS